MTKSSTAPMARRIVRVSLIRFSTTLHSKTIAHERVGIEYRRVCFSRGERTTWEFMASPQIRNCLMLWEQGAHQPSKLRIKKGGRPEIEGDPWTNIWSVVGYRSTKCQIIEPDDADVPWEVVWLVGFPESEDWAGGEESRMHAVLAGED